MVAQQGLGRSDFRRGRLTLSWMVVGVVLVASVLSPASGHDEQDSSAPATLKAPLVGLVTRDGMPSSDRPFIDGAVARVLWRDLVSKDDSGRIFDGPGWAHIDELLSAGFRVKLRLMAGVYAPDFVKQIGGPGISGDTFDCSITGGVAVVNGYSTARTGTPSGGCVAQFWNTSDLDANGVSDYLDEYQALIAELARRYEDNEQFAEISSSACMTVHAEPFVRSGTHAVSEASNQRLWDAGLNETTDRQCFVTSVGMLDRAFPRTRIAQALNPWEIIVPPGTGNNSSGSLSDFVRTAELVDTWRRTLGPKLVLQHNGLGETDGCRSTSRAASPFCYIQAAGPPKGFQTEIWNNASLGGDPATPGAGGLEGSEANFYKALDHGLTMGACFVELPGFFTDSDNRLPAYDSALTEKCSDAALVDKHPVATMLSPQVNSHVAQTVQVTGEVADDFGIETAAFRVDGIPTGEPLTQGPYSISWDTTLVTDGAHTLEVEATDSAGQTSVVAVPVVVANEGADDDTSPPSTPQNLAAMAVSQTQINLAWSPSTDNMSVASYDVYVDGAIAPTASVTSAPNATGAIAWSATNLAVSSFHTFRILATDAAGNQSGLSAPASDRTFPPATNATLTGLATDKATGEPLAGVRVRAVRNGVATATRTAADGRYWLPDLPRGTYTITWTRWNFATVTRTLKLPGGKNTRFTVYMTRK